MLENNKNPKTGLPICPTIAIVKKVSSATGIAINDLFSILDPSQLIDISLDDAPDENNNVSYENLISESESELITLYRQVNEIGQKYILKQAKFAAEQEEYAKLDSWGKEAVDAVVKVEIKRCASSLSKKYAPYQRANTEQVDVAARDGIEIPRENAESGVIVDGQTDDLP